MKKRVVVGTTLGMLWAGGVVTGLAWLAAYSNRPGSPCRAPETWPSGSAIARAPGRPTLLMFVHPRCACSAASVDELAELLARAPSRPATRILFFRPASAADDWEKTDLWRASRTLPDATTLRDDDGVEARRFGASTSGQALLYGADGRLLFAGGLTAARGHPGPSAGRAALLALLDHETPATHESPVFGCELFAPGDEGRPDAACEHCRASR